MSGISSDRYSFQPATSAHGMSGVLTQCHSDYQFYQTIGTGYFGALDIKLSLHLPSNSPAVVRDYNLEQLSQEQLEDVQRELVFSRLLGHENIACYEHSFVWRHHLWVIQPLMQYGECLQGVSAVGGGGAGGMDSTNLCIMHILYVHVCVYVCMYVCVCVCMYVCMCVCMYVCMYVCEYVCMCYVCMHVCMCGHALCAN